MAYSTREKQLEAQRRWFRSLTPEQLAKRNADQLAAYHSRKRSPRPRGPLLTDAQRKANAYAADRALRARNKALTDDYKAAHPCVDCGEVDTRCLDFDHRDPAAKAMHVSALVKRGASLERIQAEIAKCDIRCANCHRKRSHDKRHYLVNRKAA